MTPQQLAVDNLRFAGYVAKKFYNKRGHLEYEEIMTFAKIGLMKAATRYNPESGVKFSAYAYHRIAGAILDGLRKEFSEANKLKGFEKVPYESWMGVQEAPDVARRHQLGELSQVMMKLNKRERKLMKMLYTGATYNDVAKELGVSRARVGVMHHQTLERLRKVFGEPSQQEAHINGCNHY